MNVVRCFFLALLAACLLWGCASSKESEKEGGEALTPLPEPQQPFEKMELAAPAAHVGTIQLYRGQETNLPILPLRSNQQLTLAFDLVRESGRPLSVYFYHADRQWQRDLSPPEYLDSFQQDNLMDYAVSEATQVPYTHYTYAFPNETISFRISGNYILRVTEQGAEDEVLFEKAFFVTEQAASAELQLNDLMVGGGSFPAIRPILLFTPSRSLEGSVFDYSTCFVRNGRFEEARCSEQAPRTYESALQFELQPEYAFQAEAANYFLDLANLDVGSQIVGLDRSVTPFLVTLEPDYARFTGDEYGALLNGQSRIASVVQTGREPALSAEYVDVVFQYVPPDERRLQGDLLVTGSFNDWRADPAYTLSWQPDRGRYEGTFLIKQGQYEYRYLSQDRALQRELRSNLPSRQNLFTALVYYEDVSLRTDRLVSVAAVEQGGVR